MLRVLRCASNPSPSGYVRILMSDLVLRIARWTATFPMELTNATRCKVRVSLELTIADSFRDLRSARVLGRLVALTWQKTV
jgi:hypothetical protein